MKFYLLLISCLSIFAFTACDNFLDEEKTLSAVEYNDFIVTEQSKIITGRMDWMQFDSETMIKDLDSIINLTHNSIQKIVNTKPYQGAEKLREAALDLFKYYERTLSGPLREAALIYVDNEGILEGESYDAFNLLIEEAVADEAKYDAAFQKAQEDFAKANNIVIKPNELQKEIDNMSEGM